MAETKINPAMGRIMTVVRRRLIRLLVRGLIGRDIGILSVELVLSRPASGG
jgi:hypothetical protein